MRFQKDSRLAVALVALAILACGDRPGTLPNQESAANQEALANNAAREILLNPAHSEWSVPAPDTFLVDMKTTRGVFVLQVVRAWAPFGADRFYNLVRHGYYDDARFHRVVPGFITQWGIAGDPAVTSVWYDRGMPDDPVAASNVRGSIAFAFTDPGTRSTQIYINMVDNSRLDEQGFAPFGLVLSGMENVVDSIFSGYAENSGGGVRRGDQARLVKEGNAYLDEAFPNLDRLIGAKLRHPNTVVVRGGGLFDGTRDEVVPNPGLVIQNGRFIAIDAEAADDAARGGATQIDVANGEVIIPGLFDLHAHYHLTITGEGRVDETAAYPAMFLANGVTHTFPNGEPSPTEMRALQERLRSGQQVGARLHRSGPYFGSARVGWDPDFTTEDIHRQVDALAAEGVAGFKAKSITAPHLEALIERARFHGLPVTGHLGSGARNSVNPRDAINMGIDRIEHFMGGDAMPATRSAYASLEEMTADTPEFERIMQLYLDQGTYYDATLSAYGYYGQRDPEVFDYFTDEQSFLTPYAKTLVDERLLSNPRQVNDQFEKIYWVKQTLIKRFFDFGGGDLITLGTDHPSTGEFFSPFSVHRELQVFVKAGIPEADALRFATINAARALRMDQDYGTIEVGKIADLVILEGDPLQDIRNTRRVRTVLIDGAAYNAQELLASVKGTIGPTGPDDLEAFRAQVLLPPGGP